MLKSVGDRGKALGSICNFSMYPENLFYAKNANCHSCYFEKHKGCESCRCSGSISIDNFGSFDLPVAFIRLVRRDP